MISLNDKPEFIGQIIDLFEDFLEDRHIDLKNPELQEDLNLPPDEAAIIYGSDYGELQDGIEKILEGWGLLEDGEGENLLRDTLLSHFGHKVEIAVYGDREDPEDVCLEDMDTGSVILDSELYTLSPRENQ